MPVKQRKPRAAPSEVVKNRLEKALTKVLSVVQSAAAEFVPIDTGALLNSAYRSVTINGTDVSGTLGYTQSYALALHSPKPGGKMDGWRPMTPEGRASRASAQNYSASGMSGGFNPSARQGWILIAVEENKQLIDDLLQNAVSGRR